MSSTAGGGDAQGSVASAAHELAGWPAVSYRGELVDPHGAVTTVALTVTEDGAAHGTLTRDFGAAAEIAVDRSGTLLRGNRAWWLGERPADTDQLADQWIADPPDDGTNLVPVAQLTPTALAQRLTEPSSGPGAGTWHRGGNSSVAGRPAPWFGDGSRQVVLQPGGLGRLVSVELPLRVPTAPVPRAFVTGGSAAGGGTGAPDPGGPGPGDSRDWRASFALTEPTGNDLVAVRRAATEIKKGQPARPLEQLLARADPADAGLVRRLSERGVNVEPALGGPTGRYGPEMLRVLDVLTDPHGANMTPQRAGFLLDLAVRRKLFAAVHQLVTSGKLRNPDGLVEPLGANSLGRNREIEAAARLTLPGVGPDGRPVPGHEIHLGRGFRPSPGELPPGVSADAVARTPPEGFGADILDLTAFEAIQQKDIVSARKDQLEKEVQDAIEQVNGGQPDEVPPPGFRRVVELRFEAGAYAGLDRLDRAGVLDALRQTKVPGMAFQDGRPRLDALRVTNFAPGFDGAGSRLARQDFAPEQLRDGEPGPDSDPGSGSQPRPGPGPSQPDQGPAGATPEARPEPLAAGPTQRPAPARPPDGARPAPQPENVEPRDQPPVARPHPEPPQVEPGRRAADPAPRPESGSRPEPRARPEPQPAVRPGAQPAPRPVAEPGRVPPQAPRQAPPGAPAPGSKPAPEQPARPAPQPAPVPREAPQPAPAPAPPKPAPRAAPEPAPAPKQVATTPPPPGSPTFADDPEQEGQRAPGTNTDPNAITFADSPEELAEQAREKADSRGLAIDDGPSPVQREPDLRSVLRSDAAEEAAQDGELSELGGLAGELGAGAPGGVDFTSVGLRYLSDGPADGKDKVRYAFSARPSTHPGDQVVGLRNAKMASDSFFTWLSLPTSSFWVNLNPTQPNRIIDGQLARTDAGRVLLEADLRMKKDFARLGDPKTPLGMQYWRELDAAGVFSYCTINRLWIVPDTATVHQNGDSLQILAAPLRVNMVASDEGAAPLGCTQPSAPPDVAAKVVDIGRRLLLPQVEKQVNEAPEFADLRRVYLSRVAAEWYRQRGATHPGAYDNVVNSDNVDRWISKVPWSPNDIYSEFLASRRDGEYHSRIPWHGTNVTFSQGGVLFDKVPFKVVDDDTFHSHWPGLAEAAASAASRPSPDGAGQVWFGASFTEPTPHPATAPSPVTSKGPPAGDLPPVTDDPVAAPLPGSGSDGPGTTTYLVGAALVLVAWLWLRYKWRRWRRKRRARKAAKDLLRGAPR